MKVLEVYYVRMLLSRVRNILFRVNGQQEQDDDHGRVATSSKVGRLGEGGSGLWILKSQD